jgi:hypothetical protein
MVQVLLHNKSSFFRGHVMLFASYGMLFLFLEQMQSICRWSHNGHPRSFNWTLCSAFMRRTLLVKNIFLVLSVEDLFDSKWQWSWKLCEGLSTIPFLERWSAGVNTRLQVLVMALLHHCKYKVDDFLN